MGSSPVRYLNYIFIIYFLDSFSSSRFTMLYIFNLWIRSYRITLLTKPSVRFLNAFSRKKHLFLHDYGKTLSRVFLRPLFPTFRFHLLFFMGKLVMMKLHTPAQKILINYSYHRIRFSHAFSSTSAIWFSFILSLHFEPI